MPRRSAIAVEINEWLAPVSTMNLNGPWPLTMTGATIRPIRSNVVRVANSGPAGAAAGAGAGATAVEYTGSVGAGDRADAHPPESAKATATTRFMFPSMSASSGQNNATCAGLDPGPEPSVAGAHLTRLTLPERPLGATSMNDLSAPASMRTVSPLLTLSAELADNSVHTWPLSSVTTSSPFGRELTCVTFAVSSFFEGIFSSLRLPRRPNFSSSVSALPVAAVPAAAVAAAATAPVPPPEAAAGVAAVAVAGATAVAGPAAGAAVAVRGMLRRRTTSLS